ncbi:nuclear segregation protein Bfr1 [Cryptococcus wingfieldii CBS 7118]|uniref:Nuclear segregation protein Bfr1 n=1 Tax=Cryptococcus wingfieldii CBS 7118 TaxID=1295528 RepID=A0A1E3JLB6_9TREE|nr:nuclear segregation protein Bfr1 [Cryptococcus wingfieldii CBS 7118]ODO00722.1 nuclear segregation protein Bfr1 [Cryptococcus wingfieldii CBS 7118]
MPPPTATQKPTAPAPAKKDGEDKKSTQLTKPDQSKYNAEQDTINKEIAEVKTKLDAIRSRIALSQAPTSNDRRSAIKSELDSLRGEQAKFRGDRNKLFEDMKRLQESVQKKIKEVQGSRGKLVYRTVSEVDARIEELDGQVESGNLKLVDEKKALQEISNLKRSRRTLEANGSIDDSIAADKARIEDLKKQLDDPEAKKLSERFDELKKEMDGLREDSSKAYEERGKLFDERNALSAEMDELYNKKRQSAQKYRESNDKYYAKVQADRQARQERFKADKAREETERREEEIVRLREEAKIPAYASEIDDTGVLISWFKGKYGSGEVPSTHAGGKGVSNVVEGVKPLETRKVDDEAFKGMTLKKKGEDDLAGFFGGSGKSKKKGGKKGSTNGSGTATPVSQDGEKSGKEAAVNLPMSLLSALLSLGIPPPSGKDDVQRTVDDLEKKKAWFEANSAAKTKAEIERVEKVVAKLQKKNAVAVDEASAEISEKGGLHEPLHTVAVEGSASGPENVLDEGEQLPTNAGEASEVKKVDSKLEEAKETLESEE